MGHDGRTAAGRWREEPFRPLFPLAVLLGWVGVGHWLLYAAGVTATYSCLLHGLVQSQAFLMAFAAGFLLTALPRRTRTPPPTGTELALTGGLLAIVAGATVVERFAVAEAAYLALCGVLLRFAVPRLVGVGAGRRPPAAFVLVPIGFGAALAGGGCIFAWNALDAPATALVIGRLLVEQGLWLCLIVGVGNLILPLVAGTPPPADVDAGPVEGQRAVAFAAAGLLIVASLVVEPFGWDRVAPVVRAAVTAAGLAASGASRGPTRPGVHRRFVWIATWLTPLGLALSGLFPDLRVAALHVAFIGGFSLLAFGVATHVALGHLDLAAHATGRPPAVVMVGTGLLLATAARVAADVSHTYFIHLAWAAAIWITGSIAWVAFLTPKLLRGPAPRPER